MILSRAFALLCLVSLLAGAVSGVRAGTERVADARTQAVLRLDHEYMRAVAETTPDEEKKASPLQITSNDPYSYATATQLFWHSVTAYCTDTNSIGQWNCPSCQQFGPFAVTGVLNNGANQGYVGYFTQGLPSSPIPGIPASDPFVLISFRGTVGSSLENWIQDLSSAAGIPFPDDTSVKVTLGFWNAYTSLRSALLGPLAKAVSASGARTILVTGHSLGAAMAELCAIDLKLTLYPNMHFATYTQGTPRVGNAAFTNLFTSQIDVSFREIHYHDLVPHLPPMLLGFRHAPMEIWFNEAFSSYNYCNSQWPSGEDAHCADSVTLPISISDHTHYRGIEMGGYCSSGGRRLSDMPVLQATMRNATVTHAPLFAAAAEQAAAGGPKVDQYGRRHRRHRTQN